MDKILDMKIGEMPDIEFDCSCGEHHHFSVQGISIRKGAIEDLPEMAAPFKDCGILMVFDNHTYRAAGEKAAALMKERGFKLKELLFDTGDDILIPDEKTLGRILQEAEPDCGLMIAVGSGVINDSVKFVTSRMKIPYIVVATAPSMDGYVSDGAPIISHGFKYSPHAHLTYGLIGDTDILKGAPMDLIQAGFGDMVGKITALADWDLSVKVKGDYRCDTTVGLTKRGMDACFALADGLPERDPEALGALLEGLTLTGVAMALINNSRPASGAEHLLSHFWEMDYIKRGLNPNHHGLQVGIATVIIAKVFEAVADDLPDGVAKLCPPHEEIEALLRKAGVPTDPKAIGIDRKLFRDSIMESDSVRPRYSVLRYAKELGKLEAIADRLTAEYYGE